MARIKYNGTSNTRVFSEDRLVKPGEEFDCTEEQAKELTAVFPDKIENHMGQEIDNPVAGQPVRPFFVRVDDVTVVGRRAPRSTPGNSGGEAGPPPSN